MFCLSQKSICGRKFLSVAAVFAFLCSSNSLEAKQIFRQRGINRGQQSQTQNQMRSASTNTSAYWANSFEFGPKDHDFGAVPTASRQEFVFEFKNTLDTEIQLVNVRASCGCTKPTILTPTVKPGEMGKVHAKFDTLSFKGEKSATLTLSVKRNQPFTQFGEVQFSVKGKIRQDVVLNPAQVVFENVRPGAEHSRTIQVKYAGDPRWQVLDVKSTNPNLKIEKKETARGQNGRVDYELTVMLDDDQPVGMFTEELTLITNDVRGKEMKITVEGRVKAIVDASTINLGVVNKGAKIQKKLVLRGSEAFEIREILIDDKRIKFEKPAGQKSLHVLNYQLDTSSIGVVESKIKVITSAAGQPETIIPFRANIVAETVVGN